MTEQSGTFLKLASSASMYIPWRGGVREVGMCDISYMRDTIPASTGKRAEPDGKQEGDRGRKYHDKNELIALYDTLDRKNGISHQLQAGLGWRICRSWSS
ncbi:MAG: hypothetical protein RR506_09755 [Akkermansia sp.]